MRISSELTTIMRISSEITTIMRISSELPATVVQLALLDSGLCCIQRANAKNDATHEKVDDHK